MPFCETCGQFYLSSRGHACPPVHLVRNVEELGEDTWDDAASVHATDCEDAAERRAKSLCEGDSDWYECFENGGMDFDVRAPDGRIVSVHVYGEVVMEFHAHEKRADEPQ